MKSVEANFDGIVGPTHNYSGLSYGNLASLQNLKAVSNPKQAALQGLEKMKFLSDLGIPQGIIPPQVRPHLPTLRKLGFSGSDARVISDAFKLAPELFFACCSASSMWTANAATICPSADSQDGRVHITAANLVNKFHRSIETKSTQTILEQIFNNPKYFVHHCPLPASQMLSDEGAANHTRFCKEFGNFGLQLFVYGRSDLTHRHSPSLYPARQSLEASQAIARLHLIDPKQLVFAKQNAKAIDVGVFHNDVIAVGHQNIFLYHEFAFEGSSKILQEIQTKFKHICNEELHLIEVKNEAVPVEVAVSTYLFNSQIVTLSNNEFALIAPFECNENESVKQFLDNLLKSSPIKHIHFFNLRESMRNGGGPACLRLRVVLSEEELRATHQAILYNEVLHNRLRQWVEKHYREKLTPEELADPQLYKENCAALDELTKILSLKSIYQFQM